MQHVLEIVYVLTALGCSDSGGPNCESPQDGAPAVQIGTGTVRFVPLMDGAPLGIVEGPQGGYHFIVNAAASGVIVGRAEAPAHPCNPNTSFSAFDEAGDRVDLRGQPYQLGYMVRDVDWQLPSGRLLQLDNDRVQELLGTTVTVRVDLEDADGTQVSSEVEVMAFLEPTE